MVEIFYKINSILCHEHISKNWSMIRDTEHAKRTCPIVTLTNAMVHFNKIHPVNKATEQFQYRQINHKIVWVGRVL